MLFELKSRSHGNSFKNKQQLIRQWFLAKKHYDNIKTDIYKQKETLELYQEIQRLEKLIERC